MGVVYLAQDTLIERQVAVKLVRADLLDDEERDEYLRRFMVEARTAGRIHHSNIVRIYDLATNEGNPYLVMEYIRGESLLQVMKRDGRFASAAAIDIIGQVMDALGAAHEAGIVHRDVKPANIMLAAGGGVKMMDFGIARFDASLHTQPGAVIGTPRYMSPEQIVGDPVDARSDLFSAGVVLYQMIRGSTPFDGGSMVETMHKVLNVDPPDLSVDDPSVPSMLSVVVRKALAKDPIYRFQSAAEMASALRSSLGRRAPEPRSAFTPDAMNETMANPAPVAASPVAFSPVAFSDDEVRRVERALAGVVGPIAKIMVKRALPAASSSEALWQTLAKNITTDAERAAFLRKRTSLN